jgi:hypothetical protein
MVRDVLPAPPNDMTAVTDFRGRVAHDPDAVDPVARVSASAVHAAVVQVQSARELRLDVLGTEGFDALLSGPPLSPGVLLSELPSRTDLAPPPSRSDVTSFYRELHRPPLIATNVRPWTRRHVQHRLRRALWRRLLCAQPVH